MPAKVVVDTNIWISGLIASSKTSADLIDEWRRDKFRIVISEQQIIELYEVFTRSKFLFKYRISLKEVIDLVTAIKEKAERVTLKGDIELCRDPDDNIIIETALLVKAKYLITGDKDIANDEKVSSFLSQHGVSVISLSKFLALIKKD